MDEKKHEKAERAENVKEIKEERAEKAAENPVFFTSRGFFLLFCDKCGKKVYFSVKLLSAFC